MSLMKSINLQDVFLNQARIEKIPVTIFLMNGFQFKGIVRGFDSYTVVLDCDGSRILYISMQYRLLLLQSRFRL